MIQIAEPATLEKLRKSLETDPTTWREEWEGIVAQFHDAFANTPEDKWCEISTRHWQR